MCNERSRFRVAGWRPALAAGLVALGIGAPAAAQELPPLPPYPDAGRAPGIYDKDLAAKEKQYSDRLMAEWKNCQRGAFNHDLQNLAALADIAQQRENEARQQEAQNQQQKGLSPDQVNKALDRQRGTNSDYGQAYSDSVSINRAVAWFKQFSWRHCAPKQTSMTTGPHGGTEYAAAASQTPAYAATRLERGVLEQINHARTNPQSYQLSSCSYPAAQVEDARTFLKKEPPVAALEADDMLASAAARHVADQGPRGDIGHVGSDGSTPMKRMQTVGFVAQMYAEVISIQQPSPACAVSQLIIDPPGPWHPHRQDLFNPMFKSAGVACGANAKFETMCVVDLAGSKLGSEDSGGTVLAAAPRAIETGKEPCHVHVYKSNGGTFADAEGECLKDTQTCSLQVRQAGTQAPWRGASTPHQVSSNEEFRPYCR